METQLAAMVAAMFDKSKPFGAELLQVPASAPITVEMESQMLERYATMEM